jgi:hypothetical protein
LRRPSLAEAPFELDSSPIAFKRGPKRACTSGDCGAHARPGQTERFYRIDK